MTPAPAVAERNVGTVRTFLALLEAGDIDGWIELWADDADHYYPFGTEMFPAHLAGKAAIFDRWRTLPAMFERLAFPLSRTWSDQDTVVATFDADCVLADGRPYRNTYICVFTFDPAGRIREYREYFDPIIAGTGFGLAGIVYFPR